MPIRLIFIQPDRIIKCKRTIKVAVLKVLRTKLIPSNGHLVNTHFNNYREAMALALIAASLAVACGWLFQIDWLQHPVLGVITIKLNTALAFLCSGLAALAILNGRTRISAVFACITFVLGFFISLENFFGLNLHLDQLLAIDRNSINAPPGRMAPVTSLCFTACGLGLLCYRRKVFFFHPAEVAGYCAMLVGLLSLIGYAYRVPALYNATKLIGLNGFTGLAFTTAVLFGVLGAILLSLREEHWFSSVWCRDTIGGLVVRSFLPVLVGLPLCFGFVEAYMEQHGFINRQIGISGILISLIALIVVAVTRLADLLDKSDHERIKKTKQRQDLLYALAHDMKVPLIAADRMLELLISGGINEPATVNRCLSLIKESNESLLLMIQNLVYEHRQEQKQHTIQLDRIDLINLVIKCIAQVEPLATKKALTLEYTAAFQILPMDVDAKAIRCVLQNILRNAINFTKSGNIKISIYRANDKLLLEVADTGIGISLEEQKILFQRSWQSEEAQQYSSSSNLGLHLSYQIMQAHNGRITCQSELGQGSVFTLEFPFQHKLQSEQILVNSQTR